MNPLVTWIPFGVTSAIMRLEACPSKYGHYCFVTIDWVLLMKWSCFIFQRLERSCEILFFYVIGREKDIESKREWSSKISSLTFGILYVRYCREEKVKVTELAVLCKVLVCMDRESILEVFQNRSREWSVKYHYELVSTLLKLDM